MDIIIEQDGDDVLVGGEGMCEATVHWLYHEVYGEHERRAQREKHLRMVATHLPQLIGGGCYWRKGDGRQRSA